MAKRKAPTLSLADQIRNGGVNPHADGLRALMERVIQRGAVHVVVLYETDQNTTGNMAYPDSPALIEGMCRSYLRYFTDYEPPPPEE